MTKITRKLLVASLSAAALLAAAAPAYAGPSGPGVCTFVPRICAALCLGGPPTRCVNG